MAVFPVAGMALNGEVMPRCGLPRQQTQQMEAPSGIEPLHAALPAAPLAFGYGASRWSMIEPLPVEVTLTEAMDRRRAYFYGETGCG